MQLVFVDRRRLGCVSHLAFLLWPDSSEAQALTNLRSILESAGSALERVIKTTVYLVDMTEFAPMNAVYAGFFADRPPARSTLAASGLPRGARVEIDAVAQVAPE